MKKPLRDPDVADLAPTPGVTVEEARSGYGRSHPDPRTRDPGREGREGIWQADGN